MESQQIPYYGADNDGAPTIAYPASSLMLQLSYPPSLPTSTLFDHSSHSPVSPSTQTSAGVYQDTAMDLEAENQKISPDGNDLVGIGDRETPLYSTNFNSTAPPDPDIIDLQTFPPPTYTNTQSLNPALVYLHYTRAGIEQSLYTSDELYQLKTLVEERLRIISQSADGRSPTAPQQSQLPLQPSQRPPHPLRPPPRLTQRRESNSRYLCRRCPRESRQSYRTRGAIKRHLEDKHTRHFYFRCWFSDCLERVHRRDKVMEHFKSHKRDDFTLNPEQISGLKRHTANLPDPGCCPLCFTPVPSWDDYVQCVIEHCRIDEEQPADPSEHSGPSHDSSGSGGNPGGSGNGPGHAPGPPDAGGSGFSSQGYSNGYSGTNAFYGQQFGVYGNSLGTSAEGSARNSSLLDLKVDVRDRLPCSATDAISTQEVEGQLSQLVLVPNKGDVHEEKRLPDALSSGNDEVDPAKLQRTETQSSSSLDATDPDEPRHTKPGDESKEQHRQNKPDILPNKCRQCCHIAGSCSKCSLEVETIDWCHNCNEDRQAQAQLSSFLANYDEYQDFTCNGVSNRTRIRLQIHQEMTIIDRIVPPSHCCDNFREHQQRKHRFRGSYMSPSQNGMAPKWNLSSQFQEYRSWTKKDLTKADNEPSPISSKDTMMSSLGQRARRLALFFAFSREVGAGIPETMREGELFPCGTRGFAASSIHITCRNGKITSPRVLSYRSLFSTENLTGSYTSRVDSLTLAHMTLEIIRQNPPSTGYSAVQHLHCCHASLAALAAELTVIPATGQASGNGVRLHQNRHRRLSALRTRLRVVALLLMLQTTVTTTRSSVDEAHYENPPEYSLNRKSVVHFGLSSASGHISPSALFHLIEVVSDQLGLIWDRVQDSGLLSAVLNLNDEPATVFALLTILIMKLSDLASCPLRVEPTFVSGSAQAAKLVTNQSRSATGPSRELPGDDDFPKTTSNSGRPNQDTLVQSVETPDSPPHDANEKRYLLPAIHGMDWNVDGDVYRQRLEALKRETGSGRLTVLQDEP